MAKTPKFDASARADDIIAKIQAGTPLTAEDFAPSHKVGKANVEYTPPTSQYDTHKVTLKSGSDLATAVDAAEAHGTSVAGLKTAGVTPSEAIIKSGTDKGVVAHLKAEEILKANSAAHVEMIAVKQELGKRLGAAPTNTHLLDALKSAPEAEKELLTFNTHATTAITEATGKVAGHTGVEFKMAGAAAGTAVKAAEAGAGAVAGSLAETEKVAAWNAAGTFGKMKMNAVENWKSSGTGGKIARGAGAAVGVILGVKGLADAGRFLGVVSPKTDDQGKEIPVDAGTLVKSAAELGGAALALHLSLTKAPAIFKGIAH